MMKKIISHLTFWVLLAMLIGVTLGVVAPKQALEMEILSKSFIELVKWFINPIIFLTITLGISSMSDLGKVGKVGGKALIYFEIVTTLALLVGILVAWLIQPGAGVDTSKAIGADVSKYVTSAKAFSWADFFRHNTTIQVLLLALVIGTILSKIKEKANIIHWLTVTSAYVFKALHYVMYLAPIAAFGGMAFTVGKFGVGTLWSLAKLMLTVYATMAVFVFIILGAILWTYRIRITDFLRYIGAELLIVLGTSSSEPALPLLIEKLERMGCDRSVVGLVVPAGYSFNLDGTTIYLSMATIFLAQAYHVQLSWAQMLTIVGILMVTSKGAAGVTGAGFVVLASTLQAVQVIPVEGLALLLGVDRFMSEARAITNIIGNGVATVWLANNEQAFDRGAMERAFGERA
jgi:aerobic C4-dicarboxylate transport protein